jgi:hypothetical protein
LQARQLLNPENSMSNFKHLPSPVAARLAPFHSDGGGARSGAPLEDLDVEVSRCVSPRPERPAPRSRMLNDIKLLFAALGAGGRAVPLGDNGATTRALSRYAHCLQSH